VGFHLIKFIVSSQRISVPAIHLQFPKTEKSKKNALFTRFAGALCAWQGGDGVS
jgi:hypothetical protein